MPAATLPIISVPIQDVQLLDYAVVNKTVNAGYGQTACNGDTYMGLYDKDPYTSDQQRERDQYEINDTNWNEVVFEEVDGTSTMKLALHSEWIKKQNYSINAIVDLHLPEQGIEGAFRITTIKHILPQKKPVDEDSDDDYVYKPVTGLIIHQSGTVFDITFVEDKDGVEGKRDTIGVTAVHPFYSLTAGDWVAAGDLRVGEKVLAKSGAAIVISSRKREGVKTVYNLEVKDWHNFLVGEEGVVVHNSCRNVIREIKKMSPKKLEKYIQEGWDFVIKSGDDVVEFFNNRRFFEELMVEFRYLKEGMVSTNTIASNFKAIDAFKESSRKVVDGVIEITSSLAVSMKTTKVADVTKWLTSKNIKHLENLKLGLSEGINWAGHELNYSKVRLDIYMPKDVYTPSKAITWKNHLKGLYPEIDFNISTLEKYVK